METSTKSGCDDVSKNPGGDDSSAETRKIPPITQTQPAEVVTDNTVVDSLEEKATTKSIKVVPNINDVVVVFLQSKYDEPVLHDMYSGSILLHDLLCLNSRLAKTKMGVETLKHIPKRILTKILESEPNGRLRTREPIHTVKRSFLFEERNDGKSVFRHSTSEELQSVLSTLFLQCYNHEQGEIVSPATKKLKIDAGTLSDDISEEEKFADAEADEKVVFVTKSDVLLGQNANGNTRKPGQPLFSAAGNKRMAQMIAECVSNLPTIGFETKTSKERVDAVISMVDKIREDDDGTNGRFLVAKRSTDISQWYEIDRTEAAEVVLMEFFQAWKDSKKYVEPALPIPGATRHLLILNRTPLPLVPKTPPLNFNKNPPSKEPVDAPTDYDVLFGRGGLTNHHPGNRRYRDLIGMHRPDYVAAIKAEKPDVSKRIVVAIRTNGRFLKKNSNDGLWYDVGDRHAAEKTSQALREKSREERYEKMVTKRRAESVKRKQDKVDPSIDDTMVRSYLPQTHINNGTPLSPSNPPTPKLASNLPELTQDQPTTIHAKVASTPPSTVVEGTKKPALPVPSAQPLGSIVNQAVATPQGPPKFRSNKAMAATVGLKISRDTEQDKLGPIDADGIVIVTDNDILCGRGGRTNHHIGNRRFRDIVSLHRPDYVRATKVLKPAVARLLVNAIRTGTPPGRFLKRDEKTGKWHDIGDKRAAEKASQALRERMEDEQDSEPSSRRPAANAGNSSQAQQERMGDKRDWKSPSHPPAANVEENSPEGGRSHHTPTETKAGTLNSSDPTPPSAPPKEVSPQTKPYR